MSANRFAAALALTTTLVLPALAAPHHGHNAAPAAAAAAPGVPPSPATRFAAALALTTTLVLPALAAPHHGHKAAPAAAAEAPPPKGPRNVIIFVMDGLRYDSITPETAPTLWRIRHDGVDFANSHAMYPTVTTANASAIATGHHLGDTGDYGNTLFVNFPVPCRFGAPVTLLED